MRARQSCSTCRNSRAHAARLKAGTLGVAQPTQRPSLSIMVAAPSCLSRPRTLPSSTCANLDGHQEVRGNDPRAMPAGATGFDRPNPDVVERAANRHIAVLRRADLGDDTRKPTGPTPFGAGPSTSKAAYLLFVRRNRSSAATQIMVTRITMPHSLSVGIEVGIDITQHLHSHGSRDRFRAPDHRKLAPSAQARRYCAAQ